MSSSYFRSASLVFMVFLMAGCAVKKPAAPAASAPPAGPKPMVCVPVQASDPMIGTWYAVSKPRGVSGDFQSLTVLSANGSMTYETQLKIGRKTRPALRESGCWSVADGVYTMQTTLSNGEMVDADDPIYRNRYRVEKVDTSKMTLRELKTDGQAFTARKMSPGYRLPN